MSFEHCLSLHGLSDKLPVQDMREEASHYVENDGMTMAEALERVVSEHLENARAEEQNILQTVADAYDKRGGKSAGELMRARVQSENPFLSFLGQHGVHTDERSDTGGEATRPAMIPGYGALYRKSGARMDELAQRAHEAGFLSSDDMQDSTDNGGTRKLADMIERAVHRKEVIQPASRSEPAASDRDEELFAEAEKLGIDTTGKTADQVYDEVVAAHAAGFTDDEAHALVEAAHDADIDLDAGVPSNLDTDEELDAIFGPQSRTTQASAGETQEGAAEAAPGRADETGNAEEGADDAVTERKDDPYTRDLFGGQDLFDDIAVRPGTLEAQKQTARAAISDLARRLGIDRINRRNRDDGGNVSVLGSRLLANFLAGKPNQLVGQVAKTPADLAVLAQVYRDPRFETFRVFYTDRDGKIVGEAGYTSRLAASVSMPGDLLQQMQADKDRFGANGYYLLHNHPSGKSEPSKADIHMTRHVDQNLPGFQGHVVIDHNEYSVIHNWGEETIQAPHLNGTDFTGMPEMEHQMLGVRLTSPDAVARAAKALQVPNGHATLILTTARGDTQLLVDVPMAALEKATSGDGITRVKALVRRMTREAGAGGNRFMVLPAGVNLDHVPFLRMLGHGVVTDVVSADGQSLQGQGFYYPGDFINKVKSKSIRVAEPVEESGDRRAEDRGTPERRIHTVQVDGVRRPIENSKGVPVAEDMNKQLAFYRWFGDSKVVDEQGRPLVVYHGTNVDFAHFNEGAAGSSWDAGKLGKGFYFSTDPRLAGSYAMNARAKTREDAAHIMPVYLRVENPLEIGPLDWKAGENLWDKLRDFSEQAGIKIDPVSDPDSNQPNPAWSEPFRDALRRFGYDGVRLNFGDGHQELVAFDPEQIKSATGNSGAFDPSNPSIVAEPGTNYTPETPEVPDNMRTKMAKLIGRPVAQLRSAAHNIGMLVSPMTVGTQKAQALAKDFANNMRVATAQWNAFDAVLRNNYNDAQLRKMWEAADQENDLRREGKTSSTKGLNSLPPDQRETVEVLHAYGEQLWQRAKQAGLVSEDAEGVHYWTPRVAANIYADGSTDALRPQAGEFSKEARNLKTSASSTKRRMHETTEESEAALKAKLGEDASYVKNIRVMPMAMAQLEKAIAGRTLVNQIKAHGQAAGAELVSEDGGPNFVTFDHPALKRFVPRTKQVDGKTEIVTDADGNPIMDRAPLFVHKDFAGPLKAVFTGNHNAVYRAFMAMKGMSMSLIMISPMTHNAVIWGKAMPSLISSMGWRNNLKNIGTFGAYTYVTGRQLRKDHALFNDLVKGGLVPIGGRGMNPDIEAIGNGLKPGRSLAARALGAVLDVASTRAGDAARKGVDAVGHFWHETLLWDRIGDMQVGMAVQMRNHFMDHGIDQYTATRIATFFANRYAGAVPQEAMSQAAHAFGNIMLFSKSFTMTNLGAMKDPIVGLPGDVRAQIMEHFAALNRAMGKTDIEAMDAAGDVLKQAQAATRKKAAMILMADFGAMAIITTLMQAWLKGDDGDDFKRDLLERAHALGVKLDKENPLAFMGPTWGKAGLALALARHPFENLEMLSQTHDNPHGKQDRIRLGEDEHGNTYYMRLPVGKVVEEMKSYTNLSSASSLIDAKASPLVKGLAEAKANKEFNGKQVYDEDANLLVQGAQVMGHLLKSQVPFDDFVALKNLATDNQHKGGKVRMLGMDLDMDEAKLMGTATGLSVSKLTGGDAVAEMRYAAREQQAKLSNVMPDVKDAVMRGDTDKAQKLLIDAGQTPKEAGRLILTIMAPNRITAGRMRKVLEHASPEEVERMQKMMQSK
jgi:hypothetical protein